MEEKIKFNLGQIIRILAGIGVVWFVFWNNGLVMPLTAEAIGYDLVGFAEIGFGIWLIYGGIKKWKI